MDFYDVLGKRHSVSAFLDKEIDNATLGTILQATMSAPSAGNLQSYKIYVVRTKEVREALIPATDYQDFIADAPILLVFCADPNRAESEFGQRGFELFAAQDATIAAAYAQLAASAEGISSAWIGNFESLEVSRVLSVLAFEVPVAIIALGYAAEEPKPTPRRKPQEIIQEV